MPVQPYIPEKITEIPEYCYAGCTSLTDITIPDTVKKIGDYAFAECDSVKRVVVPEGVEHIGICSFWKMDSILTIDLPMSLLSIGEGAFADGNELTIRCYQEDSFAWEYATERRIDVEISKKD